ncbi:hypothetical protein Agub_g15755 [Astrephomene gubernaculifera]|uniref:DNA glycosylase n=1 Tax=Astrephomene gubernaculifera TaxID=47775 RepID=A0AAD3E424_9CHLO|nr:hypothetical protein Agub_g15755 [Astrephomene gubernaculifera]
MAAADPRVLRDILRPLGLHTIRAARLRRFSEEYLSKQWSCPSQLHGVGSYAADAYHIFCRGRWRQVQPADKDLRRYCEWLAATGRSLAAGWRGGTEWCEGLNMRATHVLSCCLDW